MFLRLTIFSILLLFVTQGNAEQSFKLTTKTSTEKDAGSDPNVFIKVYDMTKNKWSEAIGLDNPRLNDFENGATDEFTFNVTHTGTEDNKWIELSNLTKDLWIVESITLEDVGAKKTWNYGKNIVLVSPYAPSAVLSPIGTQKPRT